MKQLKNIVTNKRTSFNASVVNLSLCRNFPDAFPSMLLGLSNRHKRETVRGNYNALKGDLDLAGRILTDVVLRNPRSKGAVTSLGSLISQLDWTGYAYSWKALSTLWLSIDSPEKITLQNFPFFALGVELASLCEPHLANKAIRNIYFPFIWKYERCDNKDYSPIFYWHVPKTGGTSVNTSLSKFWYKSGTTFLPSYTTKRFFSQVLTEHGGLLPYISSAHMSSQNVNRSVIDKYKKLLVLRDPKERALSAWRQYRENPASRLLILPQHGFVWDYFPVKSFFEWLEIAPEKVVNPLSWTFSNYSIDELDAAVDEVVPIDALDDYGAEIMRSMDGADNDRSFRVLKNATDKSIKEESFNIGEAREFLDLDYVFFEKLLGLI